MLTPRSKIIIFVLGALVVFGIIISTVFNLWPGGSDDKAPETAPVDLSFLQDDKVAAEGKVFDASNKAEFAALTGDSALESELSPLEKEARDLAEFFVERFGTYSSDAKGAQIDDLQAFMTASMQNWTLRFKANSPGREGYFAATAEAAATEKISFSAAERRAQFSVLTNRTETAASGAVSYQQTATVDLRQDGSGAWKVNSLVWGDKQ